MLALLLPAAAAAQQIPPTRDAKLRSEKQELQAAKTIAIGMIVPFWAHKWAYENIMGPQTFSRSPYWKDPGYIGSGTKSLAIETEGSAQLVVNGGRADHARGKLRTEGRIGGDFSWNAYEARGLQTLHRSDYITAHVTASLLEREDALLEFGWGIATMQRDHSSTGASVVLNWEAFRAKPWIWGLRYEPSILKDGRFYHEFTADGGAVCGPFAVTAGLRAFLTPLRNAWGPEAGLKIFF